MFFDNHRDATMRLEGTIILYGGKAALVRGVNGDLTLSLERLHDEKVFDRVKQTSKFVKLRAPCLGYVNTERGAMFAMRTPARMWKQGLSMRSVRFKGHGRVLPFHIENRVLAKCLDNNYPTLEEAKASFVSTNPFKQDTPNSVAFSRRWAVGKDGDLLYKGDKVGRLEDKPMLADKFIWLAEDLQETLDGNR
tara:strand:+ start:6275 stop:6853 length:579 start_codon:yes stop_codon:yes gene_type:complete